MQKEPVINRPKKKTTKGPKIKNLDSERSSNFKLSDIHDMLEDDTDSNQDESDNDDSGNEENAEKLELKQHESIQNDRSLRKNIKELLPIKTKGGVIPRSMEDTRHLMRGKKDQTERNDPSSDDEDIEQSLFEDVEPAAKKKKVLTTSELFGERREELNNQKFRIGKICSSITERPEDRVGSLKSLLELMQEVNEQREKNLLSVRKLSMLSTMETFKDILPDYKIGITDLQNQKVKKDTLTRITFENELLKYYKKYLCVLETCAKALKPGKYAKRPSKEEIYLAEVAVQCLCELLLAHTYSNFSTNVAQVLVIYLNCYNVNVRKRINDTFVKLFKMDKRLDLTRHVSF